MHIQNTHFHKIFGINSDITPLLLKNLTFRDVEKLLLVCKDFSEIIKNSYAQIKNPNFCAYVDHNIKVKPFSSLFWKQFKAASLIKSYVGKDLANENPLFPHIDTLSIDFASPNDLALCLSEATLKLQDRKSIINLQLKYIVSNAENYDAVCAEMNALVEALPNLKNLELVMTLRLRIDNSVPRIDNQLNNFIEHLNSLHKILSAAEINLKADYQIELFIETALIETIKEQMQEFFYFTKERANVSLISPVNTLCMYLNPQHEAGPLLEEFASVLEDQKEDMRFATHLKLEYKTDSLVGYDNIYSQINKIVDKLPNLKEINLASTVDMNGDETFIIDMAKEGIAFRTSYKNFLSRLPKQVICTANFQPPEEISENTVNLDQRADNRTILLEKKYVNIALGEKCALRTPVNHRNLIKGDESRTFFFSGFVSELKNSLDLINYMHTENLSIHYTLDENKIEKDLTHSLKRLKKLKTITISPLFRLNNEADDSAWDQIQHEKILSQFYGYTKANDIAFYIDLSGLAYPVDKEGILNISDPTIKEARQILIDATFSVFLDHIQKYLT